MSPRPPEARAKRRFGQNFLINEAVIDSILHSISAAPNQQIIEIGPGLGALTRPLLASGASLTALEIDRDLVANLRGTFAQDANLTLLEADALAFDFAAFGARHRPLRVVGNLPYNISTPLILRLLAQANVIQDMHFMLQKEVALRLAAGPDCADFGRLSIATQAVCHVELLFDVSPESFRPAPSVWSSIVRLQPLDELPERAVLEALEDIARLAFMHRRKMVRHTLGKLFSVDELTALGLAMSMRPENIPVDAYLKLARLQASRRPSAQAPA